MYQGTLGSFRFAMPVRTWAWVALVLLFTLLTPDVPAEALARTNPEAEAKAILEATGVRGGLVVHLGCGDGRLTAALHATDAYLVHGLAQEAEVVKRARAHVRKQGLYGPVSVERLAGLRLPYVDNFVNLLVAENAGGVPRTEMMRVLAPGGAAYVREGGAWKKIVKPRPAAIDEWTHYLHDPSNNAVSGDTMVGPPRRMQWCGSPRYARHHDRMSSVTAVVSAGGRVFSILDEAPRFSILTPAQWRLVARDAFNGTVLWKRDIEKWQNHLWPLKSGPANLPRRLVASGDVVYATLAIDAPLVALDAATGETVRTYDGTRATEEILLDGDTVLLVVNPHPEKQWSMPYGPYEDVKGAYRQKDWWNLEPRRILALDPDTGAVRWSHESPLLPVTLATDGEGVFFHDGESVVCLDRAGGKEQWRSEPVARSKMLQAFFAPVLVVHDGVVLFAGGEKAGRQTGGWTRGDDNMTALDARTGKVLWTAPHPSSGYRSAEDVLVLGQTVWAGEITSGQASGRFTGRNLRTGEVVKEFDPDVETYWFHHRCHRSKATVNYLLTSRTGIEFVDPAHEHWDINHWVRGACLYGIMPADGLVYAPQHPCACYAESKLIGFNALAPAGDGPRVPEDAQDEPRLSRGEAFDAPIGNPTSDIRNVTSEISDSRFQMSAADWPTYRHDAARSGSTPAAVPAEVKPTWTTAVGGRLSAPVAAGGTVFVAETDAHTVHALDADTGEPVWHYTAGGRVDSPPTVHGGRVLFGSRDGHVYCLRAADGALLWRFRAAPLDQRCMYFEQLESVWPVHGSVLLRERAGGRGAEVWCVAGRSMFLDGGMRLYRLDALTGKVLSETVLDTHTPGGEKDLQDFVSWLNMPTAMPDILSSVGDRVYMRAQPFKPDGTRPPIEPIPASGIQAKYAALPSQDPDQVHLFSPTGFLDDSYWHRTYWIYGSNWPGGCSGYPRAGRVVPAGKILVFDDARVYGYGRLPEYYRWTTPLEHHLFATPKDRPVKEPQGRPTSIVRIAKSACPDLTDTPFTVETWLKRETYRGVILAQGGSSGGYALFLARSRPAFTLRTDKGTCSVTCKDKLPQRWTHVAAVLTADKQLHLYRDGKHVDQADAKTLLVAEPREGMEIGADDQSPVDLYPNVPAYKGRLDEVRLWRRALSAEEIEAHASDPAKSPGKADGLAAAWSFDDGTARDVSGNGHDGKMVNVKAVEGKVGRALAFTGQTDRAHASRPSGQWTQTVPLIPRGMVLADRTLFFAGPPDVVEEQAFKHNLGEADYRKKLAAQNAAIRGEKGGLLWAVSADGGKTLAKCDLAAPPVFDGLIAACGRLYMTTTDGRIICFSK